MNWLWKILYKWLPKPDKDTYYCISCYGEPMYSVQFRPQYPKHYVCFNHLTEESLTDGSIVKKLWE